LNGRNQMMGQRFVGCLLLVGLAVPILAAAPRERRFVLREVAAVPPAGMGTRVFARADGGDDTGPAPSPLPSSAAAADGPGPAASPSPEIAARARAEFDANRAGKIDRAHYTAALNGVMTDEALAHHASALRSLGTVKSFSQVRRISNRSLTVYVFRIEFDGEPAPAIEESVAWDAGGKVSYLAFFAAR